jgi:L-cysteine/cystine lyase
VSLRSEFPVLERIAYMNAGTDGPVPRRAADAAREALAREEQAGRAGKAHFEQVMQTRDALRAHAATLVGCEPEQMALTHSTTDGMNAVLHGLGLGRGDEIVTSDEEHPGLLAPLAALAAERGVKVRFAPFAELANAVTAETRLIACSHVSWVGGKVADTAALRTTGIPILYDGAQGAGAIPVSVRELGCAFYGFAGQKWLCGPDQSGFLYVDAEYVDALGAPWPGYQSLSDAQRATELPLATGAQRFDMGFPSPHDGAWALASFELFAERGWDQVHDRARTLAAQLAQDLTEAGHEVDSRGNSTLVSWKHEEPEAFVAKAAEDGVAIRHLPGRGLLRASIGAWNDDSDLDRLKNLLTASS